MNSEIRDFTDLMIWQKAMALGKTVYQLTGNFPTEEKFGLTAQVRRAAVSVSSNIAEGHARMGRNFAHFLDIARGSLAEVESQLLFAVELGFLQTQDVLPLRNSAGEIHRMIVSLMEKLQQ
jgi:four helix bundle protein